MNRESFRAKKILILAVLVIKTAAGVNNGADTARLNPEKLVAEAVKNNPDIKAARERLNAATAEASIASWPSQPMIFYEEKIAPSGSARVSMFGAEQKIPMPPNKLSAARSEAMARSMAEGAALEETIREVTAKTKKAYWDYYLALKTLDIHRENLRLLETLASTAEAAYVTGKKSRADFVRAAGEIALAENEVIRLETESAKIVAEINRITGAAARGDVHGESPGEPDVSADITTPAPATSARQVAEGARKNSAAAKRLGELRKAGGERRIFETLSWFPDLRVGVKIARMEMSEDETRLMFAADIPLWAPKQSSAVRAAASRENEAARNLEAGILEAEAAATALHYEIVYLARAAGNYKTAILPAAEQSLEITRADYVTGRGNFTDLIDTQRNLLAQKISFAGARTDYHKRLAELEFIVGELPGANGGLK
ncbi:MAG: TolC family protein [Endomicrobiia bacterium]|nr:TolC family protein [Endomicrobiia bacterium]